MISTPISSARRDGFQNRLSIKGFNTRLNKKILNPIPNKKDGQYPLVSGKYY